MALLLQIAEVKGIYLFFGIYSQIRLHSLIMNRLTRGIIKNEKIILGLVAG